LMLLLLGKIARVCDEFVAINFREFRTAVLKT
jgi:hypothetical protein